jgi:uncharacterized protein with GYD domain
MRSQQGEEVKMATFFMFGRYSEAALKDISPKRTEKTADIVKKLGGEYKSGYALLGKEDLVLIVELPGIEQAVQCSLQLHKLTGISFSTSPAISVDQFDALAAKV